MSEVGKEIQDVMNKGLVQPLLFTVLTMAIYFNALSFLYYKFVRWIPEQFARLILAIGSLFVLFECTKYYNIIAERTYINIIPGAVLVVLIALMLVFSRGKTSVKRSKKKATRSSTKSTSTRRTSNQVRDDEIILSSSLDQLSGAEFERLLALYFRDQGYRVSEVGVGGNDGGVDLVITDQRGEKTAVQAKWYGDRNLVGVQTVRELVGAKRNHDCILSLLITTSDLTEPAKKEAEQFKVDYWHGALVEQKLRAWGKWQPSKKKAVSKGSVRATKDNTVGSKTDISSMTCSCGAKMVVRKSREGKSFLGCSTFPKCRQTKAL